MGVGTYGMPAPGVGRSAAAGGYHEGLVLTYTVSTRKNEGPDSWGCYPTLRFRTAGGRGRFSASEAGGVFFAPSPNSLVLTRRAPNIDRLYKMEGLLTGSEFLPV
jgi:hypothetical protein